MLSSFTFCLITFSKVCIFDKEYNLFCCSYVDSICVENKLHNGCMNRLCYHFSCTKSQAVFTAKFSLLHSLAVEIRCHHLDLPCSGELLYYSDGVQRPQASTLMSAQVSEVPDRVHMFRYMRKHVHSVCTSALVQIAGLKHCWLTKSLISPALRGLY